MGSFYRRTLGQRERLGMQILIQQLDGQDVLEIENAGAERGASLMFWVFAPDQGWILNRAYALAENNPEVETLRVHLFEVLGLADRSLTTSLWLERPLGIVTVPLDGIMMQPLGCALQGSTPLTSSFLPC